MSRIAIISDIHGNMEALTAVIQDIRRQGIDRVLCLGDVAGFNADQQPCMQILVDEGVQWIAGNHDMMAASALTPLACNADARFAAAKARKSLGGRWRHHIRGLPLLVREEAFVAFHASPDRIDEYLVSTGALKNAAERLEKSGLPEIAFFGHTHRARVYSFADGEPRVLPRDRVRLERGSRYLVNVGTIGESREGDHRANYVVFDMERRTVDQIRIPYDFERSRTKSIAGRWRRPGWRSLGHALGILGVRWTRLRHRVLPCVEDDSTLASLARRLGRTEER